MPLRRKTLDELLDNLDTVKRSLENESLLTLTEEFNLYEVAKRFLNQHHDLDKYDERVIDRGIIMYQYNDSYIKIKRMKNLDKWIARLRVSQDNVTSTQQNTQVPVNKCANCQRKDYNTIYLEYKLSHHSVPVSEIKKSATFEFVKTDNCSRQQRFVLCTQCNGYLVEKKNVAANIWPSFM